MNKEELNEIILSKWAKKRLAEEWVREHLKYNELKERIDKAIEYINQESAFLYDDEYELFNKKELLEILKGDSNE